MVAVRQDASTGELVEDASAASAPPVDKPASDQLIVKVWSPFKVYFDGKARSVSGVNATGPFDILPRHHSFISLLTPSDLVLRTEQGEVRIHISGGVMQVHRDAVTVFLEV